MDQQEIEREARRRQRLQRLGSAKPVCVECGESDDRCLEEHHIAGREYADDIAVVCRNCHRKLSDDQRDHSAALVDEPSTLEQIGHWLLGLGSLFALIAEKCIEFGGLLLDEAGRRLGDDDDE